MHPSMERAFQASGNMSPTELGLAIDESPQNITNWSKRGISKGGAIKISKIFGVDSNWVLTGEKAANAKMNNYEKSNATISSMAVEVYEDGDPVPDGYVAIDYYEDVFVSAGNGYLNLNTPSDKKMLFPIDLVRECNVQPATTKVIHVRGESMFPKLKDGQAISIDMSATTIFDGEIYAFQVGDDTKIKYLSNWNDEGKGGFKAVSANPDKTQYPDEYYSPQRIESESIFVIGQYWWKQVVKRIRR